MKNERNQLAEKMEVVGRVFEIDGMSDLLAKFEKGMSQVKFNAVVIQVTSLLLKNDKDLSDSIIAMNLGIDDDAVQKMDDGQYAASLKNAILTDVMGFFASSPPTGGEK